MLLREAEREQEFATVARTQLTGVEGVWVLWPSSQGMFWFDIGGHSQPEQEACRGQELIHQKQQVSRFPLYPIRDSGTLGVSGSERRGLQGCCTLPGKRQRSQFLPSKWTQGLEPWGESEIGSSPSPSFLCTSDKVFYSKQSLTMHRLIVSPSPALSNTKSQSAQEQRELQHLHVPLALLFIHNYREISSNPHTFEKN